MVPLSSAVLVCTDGGECETCGDIPLVDGGDWAILKCDAPLTGNQLRVEMTAIAEIEIYGFVDLTFNGNNWFLAFYTNLISSMLNSYS